jgi:hypothetical protein
MTSRARDLVSIIKIERLHRRRAVGILNTGTISAFACK